MPLRIVTGRAGSGKTRLCLDEIKERLRGTDGAGGGPGSAVMGAPDNKPAGGPGMLFYLVPEQSNLEAEHDLFARCGAEGLTEAAVLTFRRMSHKVFTELGGLGRQYINDAGKKICLAAIIDEQGDSLVYFRNLSRSAGFTDDLLALFAELKKYNFPTGGCNATPADENTTEGGRPLSAALSRKMDELTLLYRLYSERINGEYLDAEDDLSRLAEIARNSGIIRRSEFWIDGFYGFTEQEYDVITELILYAKSVTVCLCSDSRGPASLFAPTSETIVELEKRASGAGAEIVRLHLNPPLPDPGVRLELLHLERNLFRGYCEPYKGDNESVYLRGCADCYEEAEFAAAAIRTLCRAHDYRYSDIAVICSDTDAYAPLIKPVFERYGLRCFIDVKRDITDHPLLRLLLSLFAIVESGFAFEPVFTYLKTGLTAVSRDEADRLENHVLARGIRGGLWKDDKFWPGIKSGDPDGGRRNILNGARSRFLKPLLAFEKTVKNNIEPDVFCNAVYTLLDGCGARRAVQTVLENTGHAPDERMRFSEWEQIWGFVVDILDQIVRLGPGDDGEPVKRGIHTYAEMFRRGADSYRVGSIPPSADEILVGSVDRTKSRRVKALFILGANEGMFPGIPKPASLLNDENRAELRARGFKIARDSIAASADTQFRAYRALTIPTQRLFITWASEAAGGKTVKPAFITKQIQRIFKHKDFFSDNSPVEKDFTLKTTDKSGALEGLIRSLQGAASDAAPFGREWAAVYDRLINDRDIAERLLTIESTAGYRIPRVKLSGTPASDGSPTDAVNVSRLERYAACPFAYLGEYLVKARSRREYKLEAPDIGSFVHKAIELTAGGFDGIWADAGLGECRERSGAVIDSLLVYDETPLVQSVGSLFNSSGRNSYLKDRIKETVAWSIYAMARHISAGTYKPWRYEMRFDGGIGDDPESGDFIKLRGIVDRVDVAIADGRTFVRVVDYKTGRKELTVGDIVNGLTLQLPVYLDAALAAVSTGMSGNPQPGGLFYFETRQPFLDFRKNDRTEIGEIDEKLLDLLAMGGYAIGDEDSYGKTYERDITKNKKSGVVKGVSLKKDGAFMAKVFAPDAEDYKLIQHAVAARIRNICEGMRNGIYDVAPYRRGNASACAYCGYRGACGIDAMRRESAYRIIINKSDKDYMQILRDAES